METDINNMTDEQLAEVKARLAAIEAEEERRKQQAVENYRDLVSDAVTDSFALLAEQSRALAETKGRVYENFRAVMDLKAELFKVKEGGQWSHTFTDRDSMLRITLGTNTLDNYDDTADAGIAMVNEYLDALAEGNPSAAQAVAICRSLMARDRKGNLKPSKIVTLRNHAVKSGDRKFMEGVDIIMAAYRPVASKTYIRAEAKNDKGMWVNVPLGMTEAEEGK